MRSTPSPDPSRQGEGNSGCTVSQQHWRSPSCPSGVPDRLRGLDSTAEAAESAEILVDQLVLSAISARSAVKCFSWRMDEARGRSPVNPPHSMAQRYGTLHSRPSTSATYNTKDHERARGDSRRAEAAKCPMRPRADRLGQLFRAPATRRIPSIPSMLRRDFEAPSPPIGGRGLG